MAAGGRVRVKGAKGKRWQKGQSGSCNPASRRHRQAARGRFGDHLSRGKVSSAGPPLTTAALATHDARQEEEEVEVVDRDGDIIVCEEEEKEDGSCSSVLASTSAASSSAYTLIETAHPVFGAVRKLWNSPTESHRIICAVLAAVSEVVKTHQGKDTETEYFGALVTALESAEEEKSVSAISYLLTLIIPSVPREVLQMRYGTVCKTIVDQLSRHQTSDSTALLKSLVRALSLLLDSAEPLVWRDSYTQNVYQMILNFTIHPKPKLRKSAQASVASLLREGTDSGTFHPAASLTASYCRRIIEQRGGGGGEIAVLHVLVMLKDCLANFPTLLLKPLCETLLKLLALRTRLVRTTCLHVLDGLLSSLAGPQGLTPDLTAKLISALYDHQPNLSDSQLLCAWLTVMPSAHIRLARLDIELCLTHCVQFVSCCVCCLLSTNTIVMETATSAVQSLIQDILKSHVQVMSSEKEESSKLLVVQRTYGALEKGLHYKYQHSWGLVLKTISVLYSVTGDKCSSTIAKSLPSLASLHSTADFPYTTELEDAFAVAIETMGPKVVLDHVPLQLDSESSPIAFPRSWLLPVLRDHITHTQLSYFIDSLLPLAGRMRARADHHRKTGKLLEAKLYDTLQYQIWSLLPGFCRQPTDITTSFPRLAKILGTALNEGAGLRVMVASALRQLVEGSRENAEDCRVLASYAKNYLPILFNLYTTAVEEEGNEGGTLLECVAAYTSISGQKLVQTLFSKAVEKIKQTGQNKETRYHLLDLVQAIVPHLPATSLQTLLDTTSPLLDNVDATLQKKSYKCLQQLLGATGPAHTAFVQEHLSLLVSLLSHSLSTSSTAAKRPRLKCLASLVDHIGPSSKDFIITITPEVILCTKEVNEKSRLLAYQLLVSIGYSVQCCYGDSAEASVTEYLSLVLAGLAGSSHMVSATILALSRLLYEFHDLLGAAMLRQLLNTMCQLLSSRTREVVKAAFGFIKITTRVLPTSELAPHLEELVVSVLRWSANPKSHFRLRARVILERLIRKFSYDVICGMVPQRHQKLMIHIRKTTQRDKRKRLSPKEERGNLQQEARGSKKRRELSYEELLGDSSDEEEEEEGRERRRGKLSAAGRRGKRSEGKAIGGGSWIKEESGEEPVNFLEPSVAGRVVTTKPRVRRRPQSSSSSSQQIIQTTTEGKLLIKDDQEEKEGDGTLIVKATVSGERSKLSSMKKRRRVEEEDEEEEALKGGRRGRGGRGGGGGGGGRGIYRKNPHLQSKIQHPLKRSNTKPRRR